MFSNVLKMFYFTGTGNAKQIALWFSEMAIRRHIKDVDHRPFWTFKCESCMKCMNSCPTRAIETTHGLWVVFFFVPEIITPVLIGLLPGFIHHWLVAFLIYNVLFGGLFVLLYKAQHHLLKNRILAKTIPFVSLTYYKFWGRYIR